MGHSHSTFQQTSNEALNPNRPMSTTSGKSKDLPPNLDRFNDLTQLPPEVAVQILSNLNATDLCLASCVWKDLAENELLWKKLCFSKWGYTSIYGNLKYSHISIKLKKPIFKNLYLSLDEATLIFGFRPHQGIKYLTDHNIIEEETEEVAKFIHYTSSLSNKSLTKYLKDKREVLDLLVMYMNFTGFTICDGLRKFFKKIHPPEERGNFLDVLIEKFSHRFIECNPTSDLNQEHISVLCYSLMLLSVDLYSPHVRNKMSKREYIKNNHQVLNGEVSRETLGDFYDDVYLNGHIVPSHCKQVNKRKGGKRQHCFPFYRPYGAIFEIKPIELKLLSCNC